MTSTAPTRADTSATSTGWSYADVFDAVAQRFPDQPALRHGDRQVTWAELDQRANSVATALVDAGLGHQAKVAQYQRNGPEYIEVLYACFKASLVPVNTNYRYGPDELRYLWQNCDAEAVVFDAEFTDVADEVRAAVPDVRVWLRVGDAASCPDWARPYEAAAGATAEPLVTPWGRSGDDLYLLYTGGTTGQPKGVMWPQDSLFRMLETSQGSVRPGAWSGQSFFGALPGPGVTVLPAAPLMHGTACWFVRPILARGGTVVTLTGSSLDPVELLDALQDGVKGLCIVGEAFARPLLRLLDEDPDRWDLSGVRVLFSSGAVLRSEEHTSELQSLMRISYDVFCLKKKNKQYNINIAITRERMG